MAIDYTKTNWVDGSTPITAQHMNNIENGIYSLDSLFLNNAGCHNSIYRGAYLGTSVTTTQWASIKAGTFEDLYIGDYWTINGINWRIAAFDYYLNCGDTATTDHHVVIVPDTALENNAMNETATNEGGYVGSYMRQTILSAITAHTDAFGSDHILSHRILRVNAVSTTSKTASAGAWVNSTLDLMTEVMVYGCQLEAALFRSTWSYQNTIETTQLPLYRYAPTSITNRDYVWLADTVDITGFASVANTHQSYEINAKFIMGVRPFFCIYQA